MCVVQKKAISIFVALLLLLGSISQSVIAVEEEQMHTPSAWAVESVETAISMSLVPMELQSSYQKNITRLEFCRLAAQDLRMRGVSQRASKAVRFEDTDDIDVLLLATLGIVQGVGNNFFDPDGYITREQAAVLLTNYMHYLEHPRHKAIVPYADGDNISDWAADATAYVSCFNIMKGVGGGCFDPKGFYTREQAITTVLRVFHLLEADDSAMQEAATSLATSVSLTPRSNSLIIKDDGSVWYSYDTGNGVSPPMQVWSQDEAKAVWCDEFVRYVLDSQNTLWGQGGNGYTPVGVMADSDTPYSVPELTPVIEDILLFDVGYASLAVKTDESLWAWGNMPSFGREKAYSADVLYTPVYMMNDICQISSGEDFSLAIRSDHTLWSWYGSVDQSTGKADITLFKIMDGVAAINDEMVIGQDGTLWVLEVDESQEIPLVPCRIMENVHSVVAGGYNARADEFTSYALDIKGQLWTWSRYAESPKPEMLATNCLALVRNHFDDTVFYIDDRNTLQALVWDGTAFNAVALAGDVLYAVTSMDRMLFYITGDGALWMCHFSTEEGSVESPNGAVAPDVPRFLFMEKVLF